MTEKKIKEIEAVFYDRLVNESCNGISCDVCELDKCPVDILNKVLKKEIEQ